MHMHRLGYKLMDLFHYCVSMQRKTPCTWKHIHIVEILQMLTNKTSFLPSKIMIELQLFQVLLDAENVVITMTDSQSLHISFFPKTLTAWNLLIQELYLILEI